MAVSGGLRSLLAGASPARVGSNRSDGPTGRDVGLTSRGVTRADGLPPVTTRGTTSYRQPSCCQRNTEFWALLSEVSAGVVTAANGDVETACQRLRQQEWPDAVCPDGAVHEPDVCISSGGASCRVTLDPIRRW